MKMYRGKLNTSEVQLTINTLSAYYEAHRAIIAALLVALAITTLGMCYFATQGVTRGLSVECQMLLEQQDEAFRNCR